MGGGNLPPELEGQDLIPETLEKIQGEDRTAMQRVIICYYPKETQDIADFLGVEPDRMKVVYEFSELKK